MVQQQYPSIVPNNGLAPSIIWTNGGLFCWRIYASLGLDELGNYY